MSDKKPDKTDKTETAPIKATKPAVEHVRLFDKNGATVHTGRIRVSIDGAECITFDEWVKLS